MKDLLFEVGCEEIPAGMIEEALAAFERVARWHLAEANVPHGRVEIFSTPRRIALRVANLPDRTPEKVERLKGPPERVAFGADGAPTKAAEGFARKAGVAVGALERADGYVWAEARTPGRPTVRWRSARSAAAGWRWPGGYSRVSAVRPPLIAPAALPSSRSWRIRASVSRHWSSAVRSSSVRKIASQPR